MQESLYYEFQINIHRIYVDINFPCNLQVKWRKGKHQSSGKFFKITDSIHFIDINDFIGIKVRCKYVDNRFLPQQTKVQVLLFPLQSNQIKVAGEIQKFDLTQMLLPDRRRENTQKKFELPLAKSTPNSRIVFTIYAKYLMDGQNQQSLADMSFQAQTNSTFNQSTTDMTFRPPSDNRRSSRQKEEIETRSPLMPPKAEIRPENRQQRIYSRESRNDNGRQNRDYSRYENNKGQTRNQQRYEQKNQHPFSKVDMPLGFSFGPQMAPQDKDRQMKELLENFNEVNRELIQKKKECERLQSALRQGERERGGIDEKKLQLINELNSAVTQVDNLKKERSQFVGQISRLKEDIRELQNIIARLKEQNKDSTANFNRLREQTSQQNRELSDRLDRKQREVEQLSQKLNKLQRENEDLKKDLFRKQSELITSQNQAEEAKVQYLNKSVPIIQQLKRVNQDLGKQRVDLQKALNDASSQLSKELSLRQEAERRAKASADELEREKQKIKNLIVAFEDKQQENKSSLHAIEQQMQHFFAEKDQELRDKDHSLKEKDRIIDELTRKLAEQSKRREEEARRREEEFKKNQLISKDCEGNQILISQLRVKIKHLEDACQNLEKDLAEREKECTEKGEFIDRVREYVSKMEHEAQQKDTAIKERDEFIAKAKEFITTRERELLAEIERVKKETMGVGNEEVQKLKAEIANLISQGKKREDFVAELVEEGNSLQQRLEDAESDREGAERRAGELQEYAGHMQQRLQLLQQEMQELVRKTRSQQQTLSELVKNKLEMQIQLNLCNFQLQNLRRRS